MRPNLSSSHRSLIGAGLTLFLALATGLGATTNEHSGSAPSAIPKGSPSRYTVIAPEGWSHLLPSQLTSLEGKRGDSPGPVRTTIGYAPVVDEKVVSMPFILVQDIGFKRVPESVLHALQNESMREFALRDYLRPQAFDDSEIVDSDYDTNRHVLTVSLVRNDPSAGFVREIAHVHHAEHGVIVVTCAAKTAEFERWNEMFAKTLSSFRLATEQQYASRPCDPALDRMDAAQGALKSRLALFGVLTFTPIVTWFLKRRFCEVRSDEI